ncbi:MAG: hypothetical protein C4547_08975 [Phycisphaerales bacterium]|nr:MAG: hypothetical protein C4547_08975 [Phycisphaerales bacterium]
MKVYRRRAVLIGEMLTIIMVFLIGSGLILTALNALLEAHQRVVEGSNRAAMIDDFLHKLRSDVRRADAAHLSAEPAADGAVQCLTLPRADGEAVYRVEGHAVTRSAVGLDTATHVWDDPDLSVRFIDESVPMEARRLVRVIVTWKPTRTHDTAPTRTFDAAIRTAGQQSGEGERHD